MSGKRDASGYGKYYWCIKTNLSKDGEIYAWADSVRVGSGGELCLMRDRDTGEEVNMLIPAGKWFSIYAASVIDGAAVAVQHWKGEVNP